MQNIMSAFPSKYLKASDFEGGPQLLTMKRVTIEEIANGEHKPVLHVDEHDKGIVLNKTNAKTIAKLYGTNPDKWSGKPVVAYSAMVEFRGDMVESIRIRKPVKKDAESENPADGLDDDIPF